MVGVSHCILHTANRLRAMCKLNATTLFIYVGILDCFCSAAVLVAVVAVGLIQWLS